MVFAALVLKAFILTSPVLAQHNHLNEMASAMNFDSRGMVMNNNEDKLPLDCAGLTGSVEFSIYAGTDYASEFPGTVFGLSQHEIRVAPCSKVTITFINEDDIRHQWMLHGLPRYLYPGGMFSIEVAGGESRTGSFIVPGDDQTYLVHCDMTQHMEKGMKGQLLVGKGGGNLWSIPGISADFITTDRVTRSELLWSVLALLFGCGIGWFLFQVFPFVRSSRDS